MGKYYAVRTGHSPGVYTNWTDCLDQIRGFKGAKFKSFQTTEEAELFVSGKDPSLDPTSTSYVAKFYGVRSGKVPGVYTDWASAEKQVIGVLKPKVRCFSTQEEAEAFVRHPTTPIDWSPEKRKSVDTIICLSDAAVSENHNEHKDNAINGEAPPKKRKYVRSNFSEKERSQSRKNSLYIRDERFKPKETCQNTSTAANGPILRIYTDGSALANGTNSSMAGVGVWFGEMDTRNISEPLLGPRQTNQRAELTAILRAINVAPNHREILIFTDSQYAINCVTVWHQNWKRNNWTTSIGRPVENRDLIQHILDAIKAREDHGSRTRFEWVKGHTGLKDGNSEADRLAVEGARMNRNANL